jgi:hypothetical protein
MAEGGYGWSAAKAVTLRPETDDDAAPQRMGALDLGELAIRGGMFRIGLAVTF